jgi:hypothetical protein
MLGCTPPVETGGKRRPAEGRPYEPRSGLTHIPELPVGNGGRWAAGWQGCRAAGPPGAAQFAKFDTVANFRWGGDLQEMACALAAAAALTRLSDGVWFDPQEGECRDAAGAIAEARAGLGAAD